MGANYFDDNNDVKLRLAEHNELIVAYLAPVLLNDRAGQEEKSSIHIADVIRMKELIIRLKKRSRSTAVVDSGGDKAVERKAS